MSKQQINLIVLRESESFLFKRLRFYLPIAATISITLFLLIFFASIIYINANISEYNHLTTDVEKIENDIKLKHESEVYYTLTAKIVKTLNNLLSKSYKFSKVLSEVFELRGGGIEIPAVFADDSGKVSLSIRANSSDDLYNFIEKLLNFEEQGNKFFRLEANNIIRDKKGQYLFNISFMIDKSLIQ